MAFSPSTIPQGNTPGLWVLGVTLSPASVANATTAEQTFALTGVHLGDAVSVNKPTNQGGLFVAGSRVSAKDVLAISFGNVTSATITPTSSEVYTVQVNRPENLSSGVSALPIIP